MLRASALLLSILFFDLTLAGQSVFISESILPGQVNPENKPSFFAGNWKQGFVNRNGILENYDGKDTWLMLNDSGNFEFEVLNEKTIGKWEYDEKQSIITFTPGLSLKIGREHSVSIIDSLSFSMKEVKSTDEPGYTHTILYHKLKKPDPIPDNVSELKLNNPASKQRNLDPDIREVIGEWKPFGPNTAEQSPDYYDYRFVFTEDFTCYYVMVEAICGNDDFSKMTWEYNNQTHILSQSSDGGVTVTSKCKIERLDSKILQLRYIDLKTGAEGELRNFRK